MSRKSNATKYLPATRASLALDQHHSRLWTTCTDKSSNNNLKQEAKVIWQKASLPSTHYITRQPMCLQLTIFSSYTLQRGRICPKIANSAGESGPQRTIPSKSTTQMASWSVHPFLQGSRLYPTDRPCYIDSNRLHLTLCIWCIIAAFNIPCVGW